MELTTQNKHLLNGMETALEPGYHFLFMSPEKHFQCHLPLYGFRETEKSERIQGAFLSENVEIY
ncbi:hypothetical protein TorRG33x02_170990 [Trema orientale]|uniref:Uncharacterized protein n=1 Tax=Trema orientale TaxID=63057 RepID=A0A2P5ENM3_TREOI|nr:hypothetical protein TorRG33x02_170990 [Trema orientale]